MKRRDYQGEILRWFEAGRTGTAHEIGDGLLMNVMTVYKHLRELREKGKAFVVGQRERQSSVRSSCYSIDIWSLHDTGTKPLSMMEQAIASMGYMHTCWMPDRAREAAASIGK